MSPVCFLILIFLYLEVYSAFKKKIKDLKNVRHNGLTFTIITAQIISLQGFVLSIHIERFESFIENISSSKWLAANKIPSSEAKQEVTRMYLNEPCCRYHGEEPVKLSHDKFCRPAKTNHHPAGLPKLWHHIVPRASTSSKAVLSQHEFTFSITSSCQKFVNSKSSSLVISGFPCHTLMAGDISFDFWLQSTVLSRFLHFESICFWLYHFLTAEINSFFTNTQDCYMGLYCGNYPSSFSCYYSDC